MGNGLGFQFLRVFAAVLALQLVSEIGATLVATYILGNCWRCFLENGTYVRQEQQIGETYTNHGATAANW